jgi:hypothetical protein
MKIIFKISGAIYNNYTCFLSRISSITIKNIDEKKGLLYPHAIPFK